MAPNEIGLGLSAVIASIVTVIGTFGIAWLNLWIKGVRPEEVATAVKTDRIEYRKGVDESVAMAIKIAHEAQQDAAECQEKVKEALDMNKGLHDQNEALRTEVGLLRVLADRVPTLEARIEKLTLIIRKCRVQIRAYKVRLTRKGKRRLQ